MQVIEAPASLEAFKGSKAIKGIRVYVAGSIVVDESKKCWIYSFIDKLGQHFQNKNLFVFHPMQKDWDSDWGITKADPKFRKQFEWELEAQELADIIVMHFEHDALAPISLMEFGLNVRPIAIGYSRLIVHCPEGFWKKGNVDIVCAKYGIKQAKTFDNLVKMTIRQIKRLNK